jgi:hypothetical protein
MSITPQHTQELLHRAYVLAVAASAGLNVSSGGELDYGVDAVIHSIVEMPHANGRTVRVHAGVPLKLQLKATTQCRLSGQHVHYDCDGDAYDRLVFQNSHATSPVVLVVFCQPGDPSDWVQVTEDSLTLRTACYWHFLTGTATAQTSWVIRIPKHQLLTPAALRGIMDRINSGGTP